jgi:glycosidase
MVESFVDGAGQYDYGVGYGPSHHRGDLVGIIAALPYIKSLGVNAIWLTPVFDPGFSEDQWSWAQRLSATGYFAKDYFAVAPRLGNRELLKRLVDEAHRLELYVFFDGVFGHHKQTGVIPSPHGLLPYGPSGGLSYPQSLPFFKEVATHWINELEIDGWRLDVANEVPISAWREIRKETEALCQRRKEAGYRWGTLCYMVGEVWKDEPTIQNAIIGPMEAPGLSSAFNFSLRYALVKVLATQEDVTAKDASRAPASLLATQLDRNERIFADHSMINFMLGNHDLVRFGDLIERAGYPGPSDMSYYRRHAAAFSFMVAQSGPITLYYNEELGAEVPGFAQKEGGGCADRDRCDDHVARTSGQVPGVAGPPLTAAQNELLKQVQQLFRLRQNYPALSHGARRHIFSDATLFADLKVADHEQILYVLNAGTVAREMVLPLEKLSAGGPLLVNLLTRQTLAPQDGRYLIKMEPLSGAFWQLFYPKSHPSGHP